MNTPVTEMGKLGLHTPLPQDQAQVLTPTTPAELVLLASPTSTTTDDPMTEGTRSGLDGGGGVDGGDSHLRL